MIVDVIFVFAVAAQIVGDTEIDKNSASFQTLEQCRGARNKAVDDLKSMKKDAKDHGVDVQFYISECTPVPVTEIK